jgi:molybdopterin converting factor subunit 1
MEIRIRFFASIREKLRRNDATCSVAAGATVSDLLDLLCAQYPVLCEVRTTLSVAVNREYVDPQHALGDNDEVALIPPVSGGLDVRDRHRND